MQHSIHTGHRMHPSFGMHLLATPFSGNAAEFYRNFGMPIYP